MTAGTRPTELATPIRATFGISEPGQARANPYVFAFATASDPALSLPVVTLAGDLPDELLDELEETFGGGC